MIQDCRDGKIDLILTKSISRFSRNTVDCLKYTRELKGMNIAVFFEKKDFYTGKAPENADFMAFPGAFWCLGGV